MASKKKPTRRAAPARAPRARKAEAELPAAVYVRVSDLRPWLKNPRQNEEAVEPVARSIKQYGFGAPLIARRANGEIIAGHTRLKAAIKLGLKQVPVRYLDLTEAEAHSLARADNRLGELATWDDAELLEQLKALDAQQRQLEGWSDKDMAALERAVLGGTGGEVTEDQPPEPPKVPITKRGDVWQLGRHRLICGDATDPEVLATLLDGRKVGLMATDPPYGVAIVTGTKDPTHAKHRQGEERNRSIDNDDLDPRELEQFLSAAWEAALPHLVPGCAWYVWFASSMATPAMRACERLGGARHQIVWVKHKFVFSRCDYHYRHEPCMYGWVPGAGHTWLGSRDQDTVWDLKADQAVGELVHPSVKPVELWARPIANHLGADGALLDPFAGSGPAFSAAEQLGRVCYGAELDPRYCDVIVGRWEALTGGRGVRLEGGGEAVRSKRRAAV